MNDFLESSTENNVKASTSGKGFVQLPINSHVEFGLPEEIINKSLLNHQDEFIGCFKIGMGDYQSWTINCLQAVAKGIGEFEKELEDSSKAQIESKNKTKSLRIYIALPGNSTISQVATFSPDEMLNNAFKKYSPDDDKEKSLNDFAKALRRIIEMYKEDALISLERIIDLKLYEEEAVARALETLGEIRMPESLKRIKYILASVGLRDSSAIIRCGAITALASIGDKQIIPSLESALKTEKDTITKKLLSAVLVRLNKS